MSIYTAMCVYWKIWSIAEVFNPSQRVGTRWEMCFPPVHSAKLKTIYKNEQNCQFRHYFHSNFLHPHVLFTVAANKKLTFRFRTTIIERWRKLV